MTKRADMPLIGPLISSPEGVTTMVWGGVLLDLFIVPLLFWKRTRAFAFVLAIGFHLSNHLIFTIGIFPWMMMGATTLFLAPDWPRRLAHRWFSRPGADAPPAPPAPASSPFSRLAVVLTITWLVVQCLVPLRHHLYPGDPSWTEEGHMFAWRMKLRSKRGAALFVIRNPDTGAEMAIEPRRYLTKKQTRKMVTRPDMIRRFAHWLARHYETEEGHERLEVRVLSHVTLNGGPDAPLVDPNVDLAAQPWTLAPSTWILPRPEPERPTTLASE